MSEEDIKLNFITPAVQKEWKQNITMETNVNITDGQINLRGNMVSRGKPQRVDYLLYLNAQTPIAVIEAKDNKHSVSHGLQQAIAYAQKLDLLVNQLGELIITKIKTEKSLEKIDAIKIAR